MTTPTPKDAVPFDPPVFCSGIERDCKHGQLARSCHICELERELAAAREELAQFREDRTVLVDVCKEWQDRAERAEGQVERLLLDSEAAHANLTALRDDRRKLQKALAFWMPCIASEDTPAGRRVAEEAFLLVGIPTEDDEPNAQELGWIVMDSEAKLLRAERTAAEAQAEKNAKDAERYRWLRDKGDATWQPMADRLSEGAAGIDAAIDAAIAGEKK